ncbi:hypothetical protein [Phenylobacterium sp.]|uniref:hypothetical protein n=1 Tax=Phenylobacterium sp. TaxID=1871053 RepID=UPI002FE2D8AD
MHCYIVEYRAYAREHLDGRWPTYSRLVSLGKAIAPAGPVELWVLQSGARPGSDYTLLASKMTSTPIDAFDVLPVECPRDNVRETPPIDILITRYCSMNSKAELIALARRMVKRRPLGRLEFVGPAE